jgi:hypothetical protein
MAKVKQGQIPFPVAKKIRLYGHKQLDLEGNKSGGLDGLRGLA